MSSIALLFSRIMSVLLAYFWLVVDGNMIFSAFYAALWNTVAYFMATRGMNRNKTLLTALEWSLGAIPILIFLLFIFDNAMLSLTMTVLYLVGFLMPHYVRERRGNSPGLKNSESRNV